jgi:hypothetical protein
MPFRIPPVRSRSRRKALLSATPNRAATEPRSTARERGENRIEVARSEDHHTF